MKRGEKLIVVTLSLPVVAPLLDVIKAAADRMAGATAAPTGLGDLDAEMQSEWTSELLAAQNAEVRDFLALFDEEFFANGRISFKAANAEPMIRACASVRLNLRAGPLAGLPNEVLETGEVALEALAEAVRKAFMTYLFLATIQELIIQHLDSAMLEE
jgi:hypothetical protein